MNETTKLHIYLFGQFELYGGGTSIPLPRSPVTRSLLAYLIMHRGRLFARDLLAGTFWPDRTDPRARRALSHALWQIRDALGEADDRLETTHDSVAWVMRPDDVLDVAVFEETARCAIRPIQTNPHPSDSIEKLGLAAATYRAPFFQECYDDWALPERERLRELYLDALETLVVLHKQRGRYEDALESARRLVTVDPLRESAHRELMRLYHLLERDRAALEQYETLCRILEEEMGVEPVAATIALAREIVHRLGDASAPYLPVMTTPAPIFEKPELLPMVGRENERAALLTHLEAAIEGYGGLVLVEGEAGVGKTRLLAEIARDAEWRGAQVCRGGGRELVETPPYDLLCEALRSALSPLRIEQLAKLVESAWLQEAGRLLPVLSEGLSDASPHPENLPPEQQQERLLEALARTVLGLGRIVPHLLILDDLQWSDEATMHALSRLAPVLAGSRVLVLGSYRGEEVRAEPAVWDVLRELNRASGHRVLLLNRLPSDKTGELLRRGLGMTGKAPLFEEKLYRETDGNPLFLLETLRALHDEGLLYRNDTGLWSTPWDDTTSDYAELPLPVGVLQVIERRFARLDGPTRRVLDAAAVLGNDFDFETLAQTLAPDEIDLLPAINELLRRRFLVEGAAFYSFSHDKVRQAAYEGLDESTRRELHRRVGDSIERLEPGQVERLAYHFSMGRVWEKAVDYSRRAAEHARAVYAGVETITYYDRAIEAWNNLHPPDPAPGVGLYLERGKTCQDVGKMERAEADFRKSYGIAEQAGDRRGQARALNSLSYLQLQHGSLEEAVELAGRAIELGESTEASSEVAGGLFNKANALRNMGRYRESIVFYRQAVAMFEELGDMARLADAVNRMSASFDLIGEFEEAESMIKRSLEIRRGIGDRMGLSYSLFNLSVIRHYQGRYDEMRELAQEALENSRAIADPYGEDGALGSIALSYLEQGRMEEAIPFFEDSIRVGESIDEWPLVTEETSDMGWCYYLMGDVERARRLLEQSLRMSVDGIEKYHLALLHAHLALVYLAEGRREEALYHARTGVNEGRAIENLWHLGVALCIRGEITAQTGEEDPSPFFEESIGIMRRLGGEGQLARAFASYGLYLARQGTPDEARHGAEMLDEARSIFERLGMAWDMERLRADTGDILLPGQMRVRLPRADAPTGRPLREDEHVEIVWTVDSVGDREIPGKVGLRRHRLLRLLREAAAQNATPTIDDLADALGAGKRTVKRDLAALREEGHNVRTRGSPGADT